MQFLVEELDLCTKEEVEKLKQGLESNEVKDVKINPEEKHIFLSTSLTSQEVIKLISKLNKTGFVHGQGSSECGVGVFLTEDSESIIRFIQLNEKETLLDGSWIRLPKKGDYTLKIHQYGDLVDPPSSCGKVFFSFKPQNYSGEFIAFRQTQELQVQDLIGKTIILYNEQDQPIAWSVIARSAGVYENPKKVCRCNPNNDG